MTAGYWTENTIRHALDGTFTAIDCHGKITTRKVPLSYEPDHSPKGTGGWVGERPKQLQGWWPRAPALTLAEKTLLARLIKHGMTNDRIRELMGDAGAALTADRIKRVRDEMRESGDL